MTVLQGFCLLELLLAAAGIQVVWVSTDVADFGFLFNFVRLGNRLALYEGALGLCVVLDVVIKRTVARHDALGVVLLHEASRVQSRVVRVRLRG